MVKLKLRFKIGGLVLAISLVSVIVVVIFLIPRGSGTPDFLIDGVVGTVRQHDRWTADFLLTFNVTNNGTGASAKVYGNTSYQEYGYLYNATWFWFNSTQKGLAIRQKSRAYAVFWDVPSESTKQFIVIVLCAEKIRREFNVTIP